MQSNRKYPKIEQFRTKRTLHKQQLWIKNFPWEPISCCMIYKVTYTLKHIKILENVKLYFFKKKKKISAICWPFILLFCSKIVWTKIFEQKLILWIIFLNIVRTTINRLHALVSNWFYFETVWPCYPYLG